MWQSPPWISLLLHTVGLLSQAGSNDVYKFIIAKSIIADTSTYSRIFGLLVLCWMVLVFLFTFLTRGHLRAITNAILPASDVSNSQWLSACCWHLLEPLGRDVWTTFQNSGVPILEIYWDTLSQVWAPLFGTWSSLFTSRPTSRKEIKIVFWIFWYFL